ncbi:TonB-dependent receptor [Cesiribacter andamanensis]|uniref:Outer membrane receptor for ferrienterochelin and colicin n=1 Tax=Cesiribacter andamanensis AMV16 TaxID=1279009 RepID=M7NSL0_9BACT|nr:TonB-dependent receptor [Cesiribacter andamanensis]EMR01474.1 Outer membrane receptor for ferrienterochelin and colicin [Cesiribacter andamanensis AMV16]
MKRVLVCYIACLALLTARAQERQPGQLTANFNGASFEQFVQEVEKQTGYYIYYAPLQTDSLQITASFLNSPLTVVLEQVLQNTGLEFALDPVSAVIFISQGQKISTSLPEGFFHQKASQSAKEQQIVIDHFEGNTNRLREKEDKVVEIGRKTPTITPGMARISGQIRNAQSGELIIGATVQIDEPFSGAATDALGNYTLSLPKGRHILKVRSVGMQSREYRIILYSDGRLDLELRDQVDQLKAVVIQANREANVTQTSMGVEKMDIRAIRKVPTVMGEPDVLRVMLTLPGVKTVGEASTGFNVRGGSVDQNLILFNEATVYNPAHLFGFFSAINSDVIEGVELYKSSIPARYGGRLSSVLKISPRWGNKKKVEGKAGIGLLTSRFTIEGPIVKDRSSFILGGRATYSNWVLRLLDNAEFRNSSGSFHDLNLNLTHELDQRNSLYLTAYYSKDQFKLRSDTLWGYENKNATLKWKRIFSNKLEGEFTTSFSRYNYGVNSDSEPISAFALSFDINQVNGQAGFIYSLDARHTLQFGLSAIHYKLKPGSFLPLGEQSEVRADVLEPEQALETALYLEDEFDVSDKLTLTLGLRYSLYNYLGPKQVISYASGLPRSENSMLDTVAYAAGSFIKNYHGPEYRLSARYLLSPTLSVKASVNSLRQYIHMLSNTTAVSPTDIWKLSDPNIRPQFGQQVSLGLYKNFRNGLIETSLEGYYKKINDYLDYKGGAELIMNHAIEAEVINTEGKAYGAEFMVKKSSGKLNGWLSYTYSRTLLRMDDPNAGELINRGNWYPANHDKPHDVTLIGNYRFSHRFSVSLNCTYSTGRPITLPIGKYWYAGSERVLYADRNSYRIPDYFRTDIALNIEGNHNLKQLTHNSWTIGVYNATGRRNVYSTYFVSEGGAIKGYRLSIFGTIIPFINYNIRF